MWTSLHAVLRESAERSPERPLVKHEATTLTYGEVDLATSRCAAALRELGVRFGDRVALCLPNGPEYLIAYYATLKAGACVVPIAPDVPPEGLELLLSDCEASAAFVERAGKLPDGIAPRVPSLRAAITLQGPATGSSGNLAFLDFDALRSHSGAVEDAGAKDDDLAVILYTSGTTSRPKGVMLAHRGMASSTAAILEDFGFTKEDRVAVSIPFFHTYGDWVQRSHVAAGAMIMTFDARTTPADMWRAIDREGCTGFPGTPPGFTILRSLRPEYDLSSLRYLTVAAAPLTAELCAAIMAALPRARLYNCYGQTEAGPKISWLKPEDMVRKAGSIGTAVSGVRLRIVDDDGRDVPQGETGELVAVGESFMQGYWRRPEETARVLRPDGLHTGDLARMDADGFVFLVGRKDDVLKSGAYRVSPPEVEEVIQGLPQIEECGVVGVPDPTLGAILVAAIVPRPGVAVEARDVFAACRKRLPPHKVPARIVKLDRLPRGRTGKLLRVELAEIVRDRTAGGAS
jgi:acyl-CoA synthetase (AMP-forming)/AMP-acid ligase II